MSTLVTGAAGFIGAHVAAALAARGDAVIGLDSFNAYYDPALKRARAAALCPNVEIIEAQLEDGEGLRALVKARGVTRVIHLAAQAGVRHSIENPHAYADANLAGFLNVLEACRHGGVRHLTYASSSSVYGASTALPFALDDQADQPASLYGATKRANELMARSYASLYGLTATGLRFFTVYGPWGRPDMAYFIFTQKILASEPIQLFNQGRHSRDLTYIDDIVGGVLAAHDRPPSGGVPHALYNLGNDQPVELLKLVELIERALGRTAARELLPMQKGDVKATWADISASKRDLGFAPKTGIAVGIAAFAGWYQEHFGR